MTLDRAISECRKLLGIALVFPSSLCDWSRKLAPPSQPITTDHDLLSRVLGGSHDATLNSHWLLVTLSFVLIGRRDRFGFKRPKRNALCN